MIVEHRSVKDVESVELVSYSTAAHRCHRSPGRIRAWASEGRLTVYLLGASVLVDMAEVWTVERAARRQPHGRGHRRQQCEQRRVVIGSETRAVASSARRVASHAETRAVASSHSARSDCPSPGQL